MKQILKLLFVTACIGFMYTGCTKIADLPTTTYANGNAVVLTSSVNVISTAPADSSATVVTFSWTNPKYSQDASLYKFVIEIDSTGGNFTKEATVVATGAKNAAITGVQFNNILSTIGIVPGVPSSVDVRLTSSYGNNNEAYHSNVLTIKTTSYIVPITLTPSSTSPLTLLITNAANSAVILNWNATEYGNYPFTYAVQMDTVGGNFANPQVFNANSALADTFNVGNLNTSVLLAGVPAGSTKNMEFRVVAYEGTTTVPEVISTVPSVISNVTILSVTSYLPFLYLWVPGDYQGWNPPTAPELGATIPDLLDFEGYLYVPSGGTYQFKINNAPDWNHIAYGGSSGVLNASGGNLMWPSGGGYYYVKANPTALTWFTETVTWSIIGDATPGGWGSDTPMTYDPVNNVWVINSVPLTPNSIKFRANDSWGDPNFPGGNSNFGGSLTGLSYNGSNIPVPTAGNYKVVLNLSQPLNYTATLTPL